MPLAAAAAASIAIRIDRWNSGEWMGESNLMKGWVGGYKLLSISHTVGLPLWGKFVQFCKQHSMYVCMHVCIKGGVVTVEVMIKLYIYGLGTHLSLSTVASPQREAGSWEGIMKRKPQPGQAYSNISPHFVISSGVSN